MHHVIAWVEAIAAAGTLQPIAAVPDDQIFTDGDDFRVPDGLDNLLAAWSVGTGTTRSRIVAPSLRAFLNQEIAPKMVSEVVTGDDSIRQLSWGRTPIQLAVGEFVNFESNGGAAGPEDVTGISLLGPGALQPVETAYRISRSTAAIVGARGVWTTGNLTFSEDLPAGRYQVIGGRCEMNAATGAFRLIFREGGPRPGSLACDGPSVPDVPGARAGGWGVWGEFDINQPPTLEVLSLGGASATQIVYLDLVRVGG